MRITSVAVVILLSLAACQPKLASPPSSSEASAAQTPPAKPILSSDEQGLGTPEAFLAAIYAHYENNAEFDTFSTLNDSAPLYFDPEMVALMKEDARLNEGNLGALEADPICGCQDFNKLSADITVSNATATEAKAKVVLTEVDTRFRPEDRKPRIFIYDLKVVNGAWRIHDIVAPNYGSLRTLFTKSNRDLAAGISQSATASSL